MYTFHCDSIVHLFQVSLFHLWNSRSYKSPLLPTISRVVQAQHRKGVVTNSQQRFTPQLCPSAVSRNDPTNHASSVGVASMFLFQSCRTEASLWLLINAMLHSESSLPWRPPAVNIWDTFAHSKKKPTQTELPVAALGPSDVVWEGWGGTLSAGRELDQCRIIH